MFTFVLFTLLCVSDCGPGGCRVGPATRTPFVTAANAVGYIVRKRPHFHPHLHPIASAIYQHRHQHK